MLLVDFVNLLLLMLHFVVPESSMDFGFGSWDRLFLVPVLFGIVIPSRNIAGNCSYACISLYRNTDSGNHTFMCK